METYLWTDSTIALLVFKPFTKGNQFIQHRAATIHTLTTTNSWHNIPGKLNPVDCATWGLLPNQLKVI